MINIPSHHDDPNYRYKMPRVISKIEGRGNGIKTNITNMADIAKALKRPPEYTTKFCGYELGAQAKFDSAEGKAIVNGAHEPKSLQQLIDRFIELYVLCSKCGLPEMDMQFKKSKIMANCNACGYKGDLNNTHRLASYMIRNAINSGSTMGKKSCKTEEKKKKEVDLKEEVKRDDRKDKKDEAKYDEKKEDGKKKPKKSKKQMELNEEELAEIESHLYKQIGNGVDSYVSEVKYIRITYGLDDVTSLYMSLYVLLGSSLSVENTNKKLDFVKACIGSTSTKKICEALELYFVYVEELLTSNLKIFPFILHLLYNEDVIDESELLSYYDSENKEKPELPVNEADVVSAPENDMKGKKVVAHKMARKYMNGLIEWFREEYEED